MKTNRMKFEGLLEEFDRFEKNYHEQLAKFKDRQNVIVAMEQIDILMNELVQSKQTVANIYLPNRWIGEAQRVYDKINMLKDHHNNILDLWKEIQSFMAMYKTTKSQGKKNE